MTHLDIIKNRKTSPTTTSSSKGRASSSHNDVLRKHSKVNTDYINSYIADVNSFFEGIEDEYSGIGYANASDVYGQRSSAWEGLVARENAIRDYLDYNKGSFTPEDYSSLLGQLDEISKSGATAIDAFKGASDYYGQWATEDEYNGKRTWFQESSGNTGETVAGSTADWFENLWTGIVGMGEKALDALMTIAPYITQGYYYQNGGGYNIQADKMFNDSIEADKAAIGDFVAKDLYDESKLVKKIFSEPLKEWTGIDTSKHSVFGAKSDSLIQSAGQLGGTAALQAVGIPSWVTMGLTTMGSESENALNSGATLNEAAFSGLVSAGAEILTEKISGGINLIGGKTFNEAVLDPVIDRISNRVLRKLISIGVDVVGEGGEEILSGVLSAIGQKLSYASESEWNELLTSDDALESFIGGAVLGLVGSGSSSIARSFAATEQYSTPDSVKSLVDNAMKFGEGTEARGLAEKYNERLKAGKRLSGTQLANLHEASESQYVTDDKAKLKKSILKKLGDYGEKTDVTPIADALVKYAQGYELTSAEVKLLNNSTAGYKVMTELNSYNIESGNLANNWAENIGTRKVNPEVYNKPTRAITEKEATALLERIYLGEVSSKIKSDAASKIKVSESGKTIYTKGGKSVETSINKIVSTKGGLIFELADGTVVKAEDIEYGSAGEGLAYQMVSMMGVPVDTANAIVQATRSSIADEDATYFAGIALAYEYGRIGNEKGLNNVNMPDNVKKFIYDLGKEDANKSKAKALEVAKNEGKESARVRKGSKRTGSKNTDGKVFAVESRAGESKAGKSADVKAARLVDKGREVSIAELGIKGGSDAHNVFVVENSSDFTPAMNEAVRLAEERGLNVTFFVGDNLIIFEKDSNGIEQVIEARGYILGDDVYIRADHPLYTSEQLIGHEIGHDMLDNGEVSLDEIRERLKSIVAADKVDELAELYIAAYAGSGLTVDDVWKELICDSVGNMNVFAGNVFGELAEVVMPEIREAVESVKKSPTQTRGSPTDGSGKASYDSIAYSFFGDNDVTVADFENGSYKDAEGYKNYVNQCLNNMRQSVEGFREKSALKEIEASIDGIVRVAVAMKKAGYDILDTRLKRETKDSKDRLLFSSLEPNSDYFTSSDISTICDKRINFAEIYDEIVRREEAMNVPKGKRFFDNVDNYFVIHKIMADMGLTQPCRQCYVESMRKNLAPMANAFLELMQESDPNNKANKQLYQASGKDKGKIKSSNFELREKLLAAIESEEYDITAKDLTVEMLSTEDGLARLKLQAPLIYEAFNSFYGQSKPKMPKSATPFRFGELTALLTDNKGNIKKGTIDKIKSTGGFRLQSYSDFQIQNFADVLQVIFEAGTLGLNGHAYTKVPAFLDATVGTNLKRNISIFMYNDSGVWKIDRNDSFPYTLDAIYDIVNGDMSGNTTIIAVSQNEDMSAWIMANNNIGYFIPFHKSGMKMGTVRETIVKEGGREVLGYEGIKDHTRQQTEVWAFANADHKAFTKVKKGINIYDFWDFDNVDNLSKNELIKKNVMAYIDACEEAGYLPKFREYVMNNAKVLNNVLKYSKQLGYVADDATIADISFEYKGYTIPYGYYKCLGDFGMFTPDGKASPIERLSLKDYDFASAEQFFSDAETVRRNEILQQIANGEERERYRNSDMTTAEIAEEVQSKREAVIEKVVNRGKSSRELDTAYLDAANRDDMVTAQRMVDEAAIKWGAITNGNNRVPKPLHLYHGTGSFGFTRFRKGRIYATVSESVAMGYNRGQGLGRVRSASLGYIQNDGTIDTAIKNAKNVLGATLTKLNESAKRNIIDKSNKILKDAASKIAEIDEATDYDKAAKFFEYLTEKYGEDKSIEWANQLDNLKYLLASEYTAEELLEDGEWFARDIERSHEWKRSLNELWSEETEAVKNSTLDKAFRYILGYEYGDALIDIEYGLSRLIDNKDKLVNTNGNLVYLDDVIESIETVKDTGIYDLYGHPGEKPLIIDEGKRFWDAIPFEGGFRSTDYIVNWAQSKGYTSVLFKSVLDPSSGGSANVYADEWVFFDSNQVKSADTVTYDDDGNVIPLSERFNSNNEDIRYSREIDLINAINENAESVSTRTLLANALESVSTKDERDLITSYRARITDIDKLQKKLEANRAEAKTLRFKKGITAEERSKLASLDAEANRLERSITKHDKKLLELESTDALKKVLEREKKNLRKRLMEKNKKALEERRLKSKESELRSKIKALKQKFITMLNRPTENQYVPKALAEAIVKVCQIVDTSTPLYKKDGSLNKAQAQRNAVLVELDNLIRAYERTKTDPDDLVASAYVEDVAEYLKEIKDNFAGKNVSSLSLVELDELYNTMRAIDDILVDARKLIGMDDLEYIYDAGDSVIKEQQSIKGKRKNGKLNKIQSLDNKLALNSLSPMRAVLRMAGYDEDSVLYELFRAIEQGVWDKEMFVMEAVKKFEELTTGKNEKLYEEAIYKPFGKALKDKNGKEFRVTKMQMMQAVMSYERELANTKLSHVTEGGFTFADYNLLAKGKLAQSVAAGNSHTVTMGAVIANQFKSELAKDSWAQEYMKAARKFFNETARDAINDVTLKLQHRIIANETAYIPYEVNKNFVPREIQQDEIQQTISGYGMLKDIQTSAKQPLVITGLNNVLDRHINQVGNVHGLAIPIRDFNKIWGVKLGNTSVVDIIQENWGLDGTKLITQAIKDVQGSRLNNHSELYQALKGGYISATFMLNGSVVMKQIGSAFTSSAKLKLRDPATVMANLVYTMAHFKEIAAEVDKYTPAVWMRRQGMTDGEMHTLMTEAKKPGLVRMFNKLPAGINPAKWITAMDASVALSLWKFAKEDVKRETGLDGEELLKATAVRFNDVVANTQSMSDVLHRPEIQKSGNILSEVFGTFKTDLYQFAGQLRVALGKYMANKTEANRNELLRTVYGGTMNTIWSNVIIATLFALIRYKVDRYRDDEDEELTFMSWLTRIGTDLGAEIVAYIFPIAGGETVGAILDAVIHNEAKRDFADSMVLSAISEFVNNVTKLASDIADGGDFNEKNALNILKQFLGFLGIPANNIERIIKAIKYHAEDITNGEFFSFEAGKK